MKQTILALTAALLLTLVPVARANAEGSYLNDYRVCVKFLRLSPRQQRADYIPGPYSFEQLVRGCRALVRRGVKSAMAQDRNARGESDDNSYSPSPEPTPSRDVYGGTNICPDGSRGTTCQISPDGTYHGPNLCPNGQYGTTCNICPDGSYGC